MPESVGVVQIPAASKPAKIDTTNISVFLEKQNEAENKADVAIRLVFDDGLDKPLFFCLDSDAQKQVNLISEMNSFYNTPTSTGRRLDDDDDIKVGSYLAALSEGNWYRVRVTSVDASGVINVFFVDFGYQDCIGRSELVTRVRPLDHTFMNNEHKLAFGGLLVDKNNNNNNTHELILSQLDEAHLQSIMTSFFIDEDAKLSLKIIKKIGKLIL